MEGRRVQLADPHGNELAVWSDNKMNEPQQEKRDWRISATLLAVWIVALVFIVSDRDDIPLSMIGMATVFFVILIPAMNDLVRSIERSVSGESSGRTDPNKR